MVSDCSGPVYVTISGARGAPGATGPAGATGATGAPGAQFSTVTREATAQVLTPNSANFFTGGSAATWTLPPVVGNSAAIIWVKNQGTANLTLSCAGSDEIFDLSTVTSITIRPGEARAVVDDGSYWNTVA